MAKAIFLCIAILASVVLFTIAAETSLECYECQGYDHKLPEMASNNTRDCMSTAFKSSVPKKIKTVYNDYQHLFCYTVNFYDKDLNSGDPFTFRGVAYYNYSTSQLALVNSLLGARDTHRLNIDMDFCDTANCNYSSDGSRFVSVGLLAMMIPTIFQRIFA